LASGLLWATTDSHLSGLDETILRPSLDSPSDLLTSQTGVSCGMSHIFPSYELEAHLR